MIDTHHPQTSVSLHQSAEYRAALRATAAQSCTLADGSLVLRRKMLGVSVAMLPRAQMQREHFAQNLSSAGLRRALWVLAPDHPAPWLADLGAVPVMTPSYVAQVDLTGDLRAQMHQKWRNRLHFAERQPLRITRQNLPLRPDTWILKQNRQQQATRGYRTWPDALTLAFAKANRGCAKLFTALDGDTTVASMLFLCHGKKASYHIGHTTSDGRAYAAHNLLLDRAMHWLATQNITTLELGLLDTDTSPGLARFKLGAGAVARPLGGTWLWWPPLGKTLGRLAALDQKVMTARAPA